MRWQKKRLRKVKEEEEEEEEQQQQQQQQEVPPLHVRFPIAQPGSCSDDITGREITYSDEIVSEIVLHSLPVTSTLENMGVRTISDEDMIDVPPGTPASVPASYKAGRVLLDEKDWDAALKCFNRAADLLEQKAEHDEEFLARVFEGSFERRFLKGRFAKLSDGINICETQIALRPKQMQEKCFDGVMACIKASAALCNEAKPIQEGMKDWRD